MRKRDGVWACAWVCKCEKERWSMRVCMCVWERERDRERENLAATSVSAQPRSLINSQDSRQENLYLIKCAEERAKRQMFTFWTCWKNSQQIRGHFGGLSRRCEVQAPTYAWFSWNAWQERGLALTSQRRGFLLLTLLKWKKIQRNLNIETKSVQPPSVALKRRSHWKKCAAIKFNLIRRSRIREIFLFGVNSRGAVESLKGFSCPAVELR